MALYPRDTVKYSAFCTFQGWTALSDMQADQGVLHTLPIPKAMACLLRPLLDDVPEDELGWHCDVIHSVAPVQNQQGWGNVMYVPAAPMCAKNLRYARDVFRAFEQGAAPG